MKLHLKNNNEFLLQTCQIESIFTDMFYAKEIHTILFLRGIKRDFGSYTINAGWKMPRTEIKSSIRMYYNIFIDYTLHWL